MAKIFHPLWMRTQLKNTSYKRPAGRKEQKSPGKNGHPGEPKKKRKRFGQKLGIKWKIIHPASRKPEKATWAKKGIPVDWKPERAVQEKEGMKRTTASGMIVRALDMTWIIPGRDRSEASCSEGRKRGESWGHMGCNRVGTRWDHGFTLPLG